MCVNLLWIVRIRLHQMKGKVKIGVHKNVKQKQTGGDNVKQRQEFTLENEDVSKDGGKIKNNFQQSQKAGDNAEQVQIGGIKRGR